MMEKKDNQLDVLTNETTSFSIREFTLLNYKIEELASHCSLIKTPLPLDDKSENEKVFTALDTLSSYKSEGYNVIERIDQVYQEYLSKLQGLIP